MDQLGKGRRERSPTILDGELNRDAALNRHLIKVTSLRVRHRSTCTDFIWTLNEVLILILEAFPDFLFDFLLNSWLALAQLTIQPAICRVIVKTSPVGALEEHLATRSTNGRLRSKD